LTAKKNNYKIKCREITKGVRLCKNQNRKITTRLFVGIKTPPTVKNAAAALLARANLNAKKEYVEYAKAKA
jgi:hypothetical protein